MLRSMRSAPRSATVAAAERMTSGSWPKSWIEPARRRARRGGCAAARASSSRCGGGWRSSRPSPRRRAPRRSAWPAGARTSCRSRPAARAARGWGPRRRPDAARACRAQALRSCSKRRPVSVSRSSVSSISSRERDDVLGQPAGRDRLGLLAHLGAQAAQDAVDLRRRSRRSTPLRIASTVDLPISERGAPRSIRGSAAARLVSASIEISTPGAMIAAEVLALGGDGVEGHRRAEVDDDARRRLTRS